MRKQISVEYFNMVLKLYYDILSEPSRAVYLFLKGTGVPFEPKFVDLSKGKFDAFRYHDPLNSV